MKQLKPSEGGEELEIPDHWLTRAVTILLKIAVPIALYVCLWELKIPLRRTVWSVLLTALGLILFQVLFETIRKSGAWRVKPLNGAHQPKPPKTRK